MRNIKKIISVLCVITVMLSAVSGVVYTSADQVEAGYTVTNISDEAAANRAADNALIGCEKVREMRNTSSYAPGHTEALDLAEICDGNISTARDTVDRIVNGEKVTVFSTGAEYVRYLFAPNKEFTVSELSLSFAATSDIKGFNVYFGSGDNVFYQDWQANSAIVTDAIDSATVSVEAVEDQRNYLVTLDSPVTCKSIGVEFYNPEEVTYNLHIAEIAVYADTVVSYEAMSSEMLTGETNMISGASVIENRGNNFYNSNHHADLPNITDGDLTTYRSLDGTSADPVRYMVSVNSIISVNQVFVSFDSSSLLKDFDIYFSTDKNVFYQEFDSDWQVTGIGTNVIESATVSVTSVSGKYNYLITLDNPVECKSIGIAVKKGSSNTYSLHIAEIAVCADEVVSYKAMSNELINSETNMILGASVTENRGNNFYNSNHHADLPNITDGDLTTYRDLNNTSADPVRYMVSVNSTMLVSQVFVSFDTSSELKDFDIYFGNDDKLFYQEVDDNWQITGIGTNAIADATISVKAVAGEYNYLITLANPVECKSIGIAVKKGASSKYSLHIAEIAVCAQDPYVNEVNFVTDNISRNVLTGLSLNEYRNGNGTGSYTALTDNDLTTARTVVSSASFVSYVALLEYAKPVRQVYLAYSDNSELFNIDVYFSNSNTITNNSEVGVIPKQYSKTVSIAKVEGKLYYSITLDEPVMASSIVFNLHRDASNSMTYSIAEIAVYADNLDDFSVEGITPSEDMLGDNYGKVFDGSNFAVNTNKGSRDIGFLTDGGFADSTNYISSGDGDDLKVIFSLAESRVIDTFVLATTWGNLPNEISVYVSDSAQGLFNTEPVAFFGHNSASASIVNGGKALKISLDYLVSGCYIGFNFTTYGDDVRAFISEIGAYCDYMHFDMNSDNSFDIRDLVTVAKYKSNQLEYEIAPDLNNDGISNVDDYLIIRNSLIRK